MSDQLTVTHAFAPSRRTVLLGAAVGVAGAALPLGLTQPAEAAPVTGAGLGIPLDLARWNVGGYQRYRIPALTRTNRGVLIAAYDGRRDMGDLPSYIEVVSRRSFDDGRTWEPQRMLRTDPTWSSGDPSLLVDRVTGRVFCFYTGAVRAGYAASGTGNDPTDPRITQLDYSWSDDEGVTWHHRRVTEQIKDPSWRGIFASSGEGLQLRHGPHAGRLLQQFVVNVGGKHYAVTGYSDDHGETWHHGEPVGPGADENKVAERSDGSVLLNIRARGRRLQAVSTDGGVTYQGLAPVSEQVDPNCNGGIVRLFPDAAPGSAAAKVLALTNAAHASVRRDVTLSISFDDGATWPYRHRLDDDASAYSTATPLGGARLGFFYEREAYATLTYRTLDVAALRPAPVLLSVAADAAVVAGTPTLLRVEVTNQGTEVANQGRIWIEGPDGLTARPVSVPALQPGRTRIVELVVDAPAGIAGPRDVELCGTFRTKATPVARVRGDVEARRPAVLHVERAAGAPDHAALEVQPTADAVYPDSPTGGLLGDLVVPWARVRNAGNVTVTDIVVTSSAGGRAVRIAALEPGAWTTVSGGQARQSFGVPLQQSDLDAGAWRTTFTAVGAAPTGEVRASAQLVPLDLRPRGIA